MSRRILAILRGITPAEAVDSAAVLIESGITRIEVPLNSPQPFNSIAAMVQAHDQSALFGAGTVTRIEQVAKVHAIGGALIVSPNCDDDIITATQATGMQSWPGVATPTEAFRALACGVTGLKFFPGQLIGIDGFKAIRTVLPENTVCLAVGGVGLDNMAQWAQAGADGFGIGSLLYTPGMSLKQLRNNAQRLVTVYDEIFVE